MYVSTASSRWSVTPHRSPSHRVCQRHRCLVRPTPHQTITMALNSSMVSQVSNTKKVINVSSVMVGDLPTHNGIIVHVIGMMFIHYVFIRVKVVKLKNRIRLKRYHRMRIKRLYSSNQFQHSSVRYSHHPYTSMHSSIRSMLYLLFILSIAAISVVCHQPVRPSSVPNVSFMHTRTASYHHPLRR